MCGHGQKQRSRVVLRSSVVGGRVEGEGRPAAASHPHRMHIASHREPVQGVLE